MLGEAKRFSQGQASSKGQGPNLNPVHLVLSPNLYVKRCLLKRGGRWTWDFCKEGLNGTRV